MKSKQLKITHYFKKYNKNVNKEFKTKYIQNGKIYRKSMKKKLINERKFKFCLYELSRVKI